MERTDGVKNNPEGYKAENENSFINQLAHPTEKDQEQQQQQQAQTENKPPENKIDPEAKFVANLIVNTSSVLVNGACQMISGEKSEELFTISEGAKNSIKEPLADLLDYYKMKFNPWWILLLAVSAAYAPVLMKASSIRYKKMQATKKAEAKAEPGTKVVTVTLPAKKPGPGRPQGSTKKTNDKKVNAS